MTDVTSRTVIGLELDTTNLAADIVEGEAILNDFIARMQSAASITPRLDTELFARTARRRYIVEADPAAATASLEVIDKITKEFVSDISRRAKYTVGVDTTVFKSGMQRLRGFFGSNIKAIGKAFEFDISRGIANAIQSIPGLVTGLFTNALAAFRESEEASKQLTKALASTGEQSGKTKEELDAYAKELQKLTNTSDEAVNGIQGILLASEGLTGENFDRATRGALDLTKALGGTASDNAERLGKALQDPVRGMKMLRDAGISFSKEQQDIIKLFAETGDLVGAQNIVLDELESRYGGASVATGDWADSIEAAKLRIDDLNEALGEGVASGVDSFVPAINSTIDVLEDMLPAGLAIVELLAEMVTGLLETGEAAGGLGEVDIEAATSSWKSALVSATGSWSQFGRSIAYTANNVAMSVLQIQEGDSSPLADFSKRVEDDILAETEAIENAAIEKRKARKEQAKADSEARKAAWEEEQKERDAEIARGSGLVSEDEIAKKGAKQALKDAKVAIAEEKKRLRQEDAAEKKRLKDEERAEKKAIAEQTKEDNLRKRELAKDQAAFDKAMSEDEKKRAKEKADFEKGMGRDGLLEMQKRIQDAFILRRAAADPMDMQQAKPKGLAQKQQAAAGAAFDIGMQMMGALPGMVGGGDIVTAPHGMDADERVRREAGVNNWMRQIFGGPDPGGGVWPPADMVPLLPIAGSMSPSGVSPGSSGVLGLSGLGFASTGSQPKVEVKQEEVVTALNNQTRDLVKAFTDTALTKA